MLIIHTVLLLINDEYLFQQFKLLHIENQLIFIQNIEDDSKHQIRVKELDKSLEILKMFLIHLRKTILIYILI